MQTDTEKIEKIALGGLIASGMFIIVGAPLIGITIGLIVLGYLDVKRREINREFRENVKELLQRR